MNNKKGWILMSLAKKIAVLVMIIILIVIVGIIVESNKNTYNVDKKLEQASGYFEMMDYDKTIATYNFIILKDKTCVEAYLGLASAYSAKGNEKKAFEILEQGLDATHNHIEIAKRIEEMSEETDADSEEVVSEMIVTEIVTTVPVVETTVTTEITTTTTEETIVTDEETTVTTEETKEVTSETTVAGTKKIIETTTAKPTISVPNFIGISKEEAANLAKNKNIKIKFEYEDNDTYPNGFVYYQSNREGTLVASSTTVYIYVCKNDIEYVSEETKALRDLSGILEKWADNNSCDIRTDEENNVVIISINSAKRFVFDEAVVSAMRDCNEATVRVVTDDFTMLIPTMSVANVSSLNLSADYSGNFSRATFTISEGVENCDVKVILTNCTINSSDYKNMKLYTNNKKPSAIELTIDEEPIILVSESGTYTIK